MDLKEKIAKNVENLKAEKQELEDENEKLRQKVAELQARRHAEDILLEAKEASNAPDQLSPDSIEGFLAKRAELEEKPQDELDKIASTIDWLEDGDGIEVSDFDGGEVEKGNLTDWIKQHA